MEIGFLNLQLHFTRQYGLEHISKADWQLEHPTTKGTVSPVESAFSTLLQQRAWELQSKPGGWSQEELSTAAMFVAGWRGNAGVPVTSPIERTLDFKPLIGWCKRLQPVLARYILQYLASLPTC